MSNENWYCIVNEKKAGPFGLPTLASMIRARQLQANDLVAREDTQEWRTAISTEELTALFAPASAPGTVGPPLQYYGQQPSAILYAGFWSRFVAFMIDRMIVVAGSCVVSVCIGSMFGARGSMRMGPSGTWSTIAVDVAFHLTSIVTSWLYYALMESSRWQATLGKMALGVVVTDLVGNRISIGRATGRHFAKWVSGIILLVGYMMAGWTAKKQALHDMIAGTLVVKRPV